MTDPANLNLDPGGLLAKCKAAILANPTSNPVIVMASTLGLVTTEIKSSTPLPPNADGSPAGWKTVSGTLNPTLAEATAVTDKAAMDAACGFPPGTFETSPGYVLGETLEYPNAPTLDFLGLGGKDPNEWRTWWQVLTSLTLSFQTINRGFPYTSRPLSKRQAAQYDAQADTVSQAAADQAQADNIQWWLDNPTAQRPQLPVNFKVGELYGPEFTVVGTLVLGALHQPLSWSTASDETGVTSWAIGWYVHEWHPECLVVLRREGDHLRLALGSVSGGAIAIILRSRRTGAVYSVSVDEQTVTGDTPLNSITVPVPVAS
jgi:hypothetical protein